jgi:hypothetical protein
MSKQAGITRLQQLSQTFKRLSHPSSLPIARLVSGKAPKLDCSSHSTITGEERRLVFLDLICLALISALLWL